MSALYKLIDGFSEGLGRVVSWLALIMVVLQFVLVVMRYLFGLSAVMLDESLIYMHGCLFLFAAGYTLKHNGHVRVDLSYRDAPIRTQATVNLLGTLCFLLPMSIFILWAGLPFVDASWQSMEGSLETSGLPFLYLYKSAILVFAFLLGIQAVAEAIKAGLTLRGQIIPAEDETLAL
jgi:TRAP-type mannitol/chloroaromatic compound transport system permease small subunit